MRKKRATRLGSSALVAASFAATFFAATRAGADPKAPGYLQSKYGLSCAPDCTLCHDSDLGGYARFRVITVNGQQKGGFGVTIKNFGFVPTDQSTWDPAFAAAAAAQPPSDTDGDGVPDIEELSKGEDPNDPTPGAQLCGKGPTYGCVRVARGGAVDGVALLVTSAVLFAGVALTRRRAKPR